MNNYLSLKRRGLIQRKIFSCFSFKGEALNLNYSVKEANDPIAFSIVCEANQGRCVAGR